MDKKFFLKILKVAGVSITLIVIFFIVLEFFAYYTNAIRYKQQTNAASLKPFKSIFSKNLNLDDYDLRQMLYKESNKDECGNFCFREPNGTKYKGEPIIIFGCSFAYGEYLEPNQTFSYKLSETLKRPVYNRGISGQNFAFMYYQALNFEFYNQVPPSDTVIYVMISDHYRRMLNNKFDPISETVHPHYKFDAKKKELIPEKYNAFFRFVNGSYLLSTLRMAYVNSFVKDSWNLAKLDDYILTYFIKTREKLEKRWNKKVNFIVFMYEVNPCSITLRQKLEENGFFTITTRDITREDVFKGDFIIGGDGHPSEKAWDYLIPRIIETSRKKNLL